MNRIEYDDNGELDEAVTDAGMHLERMSKNSWLLSGYRSDGSSLAIFFRGKIAMTEDRPAPRKGDAAELSRLRADVNSLTASLAAEVDESERLRGVLRKRSEEADEADCRASKAEDALADERRHADELAVALGKASDYIDGPIPDRVGPMVGQLRKIYWQHRTRRQG